MIMCLSGFYLSVGHWVAWQPHQHSWLIILTFTSLLKFRALEHQWSSIWLGSVIAPVFNNAELVCWNFVQLIHMSICNQWISSRSLNWNTLFQFVSFISWTCLKPETAVVCWATLLNICGLNGFLSVGYVDNQLVSIVTCNFKGYLQH